MDCKPTLLRAAPHESTEEAAEVWGERARQTFAVLYQVLGALGAPAHVLDLASAMAAGECPDGDPMDVLPFLPREPLLPWRPTHRHFKGGVYQLLGFAIVEASGQTVAVYRDEQERLWTRPRQEFEHRFTPLLEQKSTP